MNPECERNECNCEAEENYFHAKVLNTESKPIIETDQMGREIFWNDIGRS